MLELQPPPSADLNSLDFYVQENIKPFFLNSQPDAIIIPILFCWLFKKKSITMHSNMNVKF